MIATGIGDLSDGLEGKARDTAVEDALRKAVEQAVGSMVASETVVQNFQLVSDKILSSSSGYVKRYDIVSESRDGGIYKVAVSAVISTEKVANDLKAIGLLMLRKHRPRVMVVIPEKNLGQSAHNPVAETEIIKRLLAAGFKVVDQSQVSRIRYGASIRAALDGDVRLAEKIGLQFGAEVIIIGEAFSEPMEGAIEGFVSSRGRVDARAIKTDTGEVIAADGRDSSGIDITEASSGKAAIQKASEGLTDSMVAQISAKWNEEVNNNNSVEFVVTAVTYSQLSRLSSVLLTSFRGVKGVHQRSFTAGRAVLEVDLKAEPQSFFDELARRENSIGVEITEVSENRVEGRFINSRKR